MAVMFLYDRYVKLFGIRRMGGLENPKVRPITRFSLPRGTVLHYMPANETELGPANDDPMIKAAQRLIFIDHVPDLLAREGNPRPTYKLLAPMVQKYRREHMFIRPLRDYAASTKDLTTMVVVNYAMMAQMYKYQRSALSRWWYWKNIRTTLWEKLNQLKTPHERHHIVVLDVPQSLPALADLRKAERNMTPMLMKVFNSRERLDLLDIWTWLGESRNKTPMGRLDPTKLHEIDLLIRRDTGFLTINLGTLNSWRKETPTVAMEAFPLGDDDPAFDFEDTFDRYTSMEMDGDESLDADLGVSMEAPSGVDPKILQLRFLKMLTRVIAQTSTVQADADPQLMEEAPDKDEDPEEAAQAQEEAEEEASLLEESEHAELTIAAVEEELAEELDEPAKGDTDTVMTDEDGELIIETQAEEREVVGQMVGTNNIAHTLTSTIQGKIDELVDKELLTAAQYRRMQRLAESYKTMPNPWDSNSTVEESLTITDKDLVLTKAENYPQSDAVRDESMLQSTVEQMDSQYIERVMKKDLLNAVMSVQKAGVAVTGYKVEKVQDAVSNYEIHKVQLTPVTGKPSTISFRVPIVDKRGVYVSNGQRYRMRTQKTDNPIRKVNPTRVALSSYYSKLFVERSQRATFNYDTWIGKQIVNKGLDPTDTDISNVKVASVADTSIDLPTIYTVIGLRTMSFEANGEYWFDYKNRGKVFDMASVKEVEEKHKGLVVCGKRGKKLIGVDRDNAFYLIDVQADTVTELGRVEELLNLNREKAPTGMAEISIFGKVMPVGMALGYLVGFDRLLQLTGAEHRVVPLGTRLQMNPDEYAIKFLDETIVLDKSDEKSALVLAGFLHYQKSIRHFSRHSFNAKDVYFTVLEDNGIGLRYLRELDLMNAMWVDPITKGILEWMKEPVEFVPLLVRAVELLISRYVPTKVEGVEGLIEGMERAKGYERIPGAVYGELVRSIRVYNSRSASSNSQVTMKPHEVWTKIVQDPASALVDDINPIQNLKQKEIITYGGRGGRSSRSMTAESRLYKKEDIGFISGDTVDSGDVAVITYMSPNANLTSVRGTIRSFDKETDGAANLISTSALISPFSDRDDPKRVNFIGIQQSHVISAAGYRESPISTGYDHVLAHRVDEIFAVPASQAGEVVERSDVHMVVAYEDGTFEHIDLSTQYGISAGSVYPQHQASDFQLGDKVAKGDILKYNSGFFKPSKFHPKQVQWKAGVIARTALMEASYTLEDSSAVDDWLAGQLASEVTKVKSIIVRFDQSIRNLVKEGEETDIASILCTIEDAVTAESGLFSDEDLDTLRLMSSATPTAGAVGKVSKIEVFYHGDPDDMSDSLLELATTYDKRRRKEARLLGRTVSTGQVDQSLRIDGNGLELDHMAIKVYITHTEGLGVGDKLVFASQMKSVIGHTLTGINETASGRTLNAVFGAKSVMDRIVLSALLSGMTISILTAIGEKAAAMWQDGK